MRIWYKQPVEVQNQPTETEIFLCGIMNSYDAHRPLIEIVLMFQERQQPLYSHNPVLRFAEEPADDDIVAKYNAKLVKLREKVGRTDFAKLFPPV